MIIVHTVECIRCHYGLNVPVLVLEMHCLWLPRAARAMGCIVLHCCCEMSVKSL